MSQDYSLGPFIDEHYVLLRHILRTRDMNGVALEFGVGSGMSTAMIAKYLPVIGFDSFKGLPENWRPGFPEGSFAYDPPNLTNVTLVTGLFEDTLPKFNWTQLGHIGLVHIDCDLYSSTKTVLEWLPWWDMRDAIIIFDEFHGYEHAERDEQRAWREFADWAGPGFTWKVLGHSFQQWAIKIVSV